MHVGKTGSGYSDVLARLGHFSLHESMNLQGNASFLHTDRLLTQRRNTEAVPQAFLRVMDVVVRNGRVSRYPVVPDRHGPIVPFHTDLEIRGMVDMLLGSA